MISLHAWKKWAANLKRETLVVFWAIKHPQTPWYAKVCVICIVAYALSPIDLIPDFIPIVGYLDDLLLIPLGLAFARFLIPNTVMTECRARAMHTPDDSKQFAFAGAVIVVVTWAGVLGLVAYMLLR